MRSYTIESPEVMVMDNTDEDLWNMSAEIRRQVFCLECGICEEDEFDAKDPISRPIVGLGILRARIYYFC